jgi:hypothetical protein
MFSKSSILARPGWSPKVFEELMGLPDEIGKGPTKTQLFKPERVLAVETSVRFKEIMQPFEVMEYRANPGQLLSTNPFCPLVDSMVFEVILFTEGRVRTNRWRCRDNDAKGPTEKLGPARGKGDRRRLLYRLDNSCAHASPSSGMVLEEPPSVKPPAALHTHVAPVGGTGGGFALPPRTVRKPTRWRS